jgi:HAD superfamily hydrolase (TIGR01490 family)
MSDSNGLKFAVFDFDRTLYHGFSAIDFWIFFLKKHPASFIYFFYQIFCAILYFFGIISPESFKEKILIFFKNKTKEEVQQLVKEFWQKNFKKINQEVRQALDDNKKEGLTIVCISASYNFILNEIREKLGIYQILSTTYDFNSKKIVGYNCKGENKVKLLKEWVQKEYNAMDFTVQKAYSDSRVDLPLLRLAREGFFVKRGKIEKINQI